MFWKIKNKKQWFTNKKSGMTYVELIVVLSIFSVMSTIVLTNYGAFQAKVDIKNLANDIALKIVEAQKSAMSGKYQVNAPAGWKPAYGVYFNAGTSYGASGLKTFYYFTDLDQNNDYQTASICPNGGECIEKIDITKGNFISTIFPCTGDPCVPGEFSGSTVAITFKRPDSSAVFYSGGGLVSGYDYMQMIVSSPHSTATAKIKIYPSGRIQIN